MLYTEKDLEKSMDKIETVNFHQVQLYTTTSTLHCCTVLSIDCVHIQMAPPIHLGVWSMALMCTYYAM